MGRTDTAVRVMPPLRPTEGAGFEPTTSGLWVASIRVFLVPLGIRGPVNLPGQVHDLELTGDRNRVDILDLGAAQLVGSHGVRGRPKRPPRVVENLAGDPIAVPRRSLGTLRGTFTDPGGDYGERAHAGRRRVPGSLQPAALTWPL